MKIIPIGNVFDKLYTMTPSFQNKCKPLVRQWHKLPPVPGWYVVAQMAGGKVDGCGCAFYSKWRISELYEEKTFRFYGPLPVDEVENETE